MNNKIKYNHLYGVDIEKEGTHYDVVFSLIASVEKDSGIQGGLHNCIGETLITIIRRSAFVFDLTKPVDASYLAEKLKLSFKEAEEIIKLFRL